MAAFIVPHLIRKEKAAWAPYALLAFSVIPRHSTIRSAATESPLASGDRFLEVTGIVPIGGIVQHLIEIERWSAVNLSNEVTTPVCWCAILAATLG